MAPALDWFTAARYGLFCHYGLYSLLGRGEWAMCKEEIPPSVYAQLAQRFTAEHFDADLLVRRARDWGMRYAVLTTKHHDGFCLYDSALTTFSAPHSAARRDLVAEFVAACRKYGLKCALYHSLNDWSTSPNAVDALERPAECYEPYLAFVHGQIKDLLTKYRPDVLWFDGWWPFSGDGWRARELHAMARVLVPGILINGRAGIPGDFDTPEGHVTATPRPWEACMTLNNNWGYHVGDDNWKSPKTVIGMLQRAAAGNGNLLLNVGPMGDGSIPPATLTTLDTVGAWLADHRESIYGTDRFEMDLRERGAARGDWTHHGCYTARGNNLYVHVTQWPGRELVICGLECQAQAASFLRGGQPIAFRQDGSKLTLSNLPASADTTLPVVLKVVMDRPPMLYKSGGWRNPTVAHCHYDPCPSDLLAAP